MKSKEIFLVLIASTVLTTGCSTLGPDRPITYSGPIAAFNYDNPADPRYFRTYYDKKIESEKNSDEDKRAARNEILADLKTIIDNNFYLFESNFGFGKRSKDFAVQTAAQGLGAAGALLTGGVSQVLSGTTAALTATNTKFDETTFVDQTVQTIQLEMRTLRMNQEQAMLPKWKESVADYPLQLGISDLLEYYQAGTFGRAMSSIAARTGEKQQKAQENDDNALKQQNDTTITKTTTLVPNLIPNSSTVKPVKTTTTTTTTR